MLNTYLGKAFPYIPLFYFKNIDYFKVKSFYIANKPGAIVDTINFFDIPTEHLTNVGKEFLDLIKTYGSNYNFDKESPEMWKVWNGVFCIDVDSKNLPGWKEGEKPNEVYHILDQNGQEYDGYKLEDEMNETFINLYPENYMGLQRSFAGNSFHIFFYFNIDNIIKQGLFDDTFGRNEKTQKSIYFAIRDSLIEDMKGVTTAGGFELDKIFTISYKKGDGGTIDECTSKITQCLFISKFKIKYNYLLCEDNLFEIDEYSKLGKRIIDNFNNYVEADSKYNVVNIVDGESNIEDLERDIDIRKITVQTKGDIVFKTKDNFNIDLWKGGFPHSIRIKIIIGLSLIFKDNASECYNSVYKYIIPKITNKGNAHPESELKKLFFDQYKKIYKKRYTASIKMINWINKNLNVTITTSVDAKNKLLKKFNYDKVFNLNSDQYLSDVFNEIYNIPYNCIHVEAGCGLGKTHSAINYTEIDTLDDFDFIFNSYRKMFRRICFVTPMTSINRGNFNDIENWVVVDSENKGNFYNICERKSVCTTWDSFIRYEFYKQDFDMFIFDEIHSIYLYQYRLDVISKIKETIHELKKDKKVILFSGTPSNERVEFNSYNVLVHKEVTKLNINLIGYDKEYNGWLINDIKKWLNQDENNVVYIFCNKYNEDKIQWYENRGIIVDNIYCKKNEEFVNIVNKEKGVRGRVILFSVYGQAGINIYAKPGENVRIYVLETNAMEVIQYINRLRNKEFCDGIYIPIKKSERSSKYVSFEDLYKEHYNKIIDDDIKKINMYNYMTHKDQFILKKEGLFQTIEYKKDIIRKNYHLNPYMLEFDEYGLGLVSIVRDAQDVNTNILISDMYEKQYIVLYNRCIDAQGEVKIIDLERDIVDTKLSKKCYKNFFGAIMDFNCDVDTITTSKGEIKLNKNSKLTRYSNDLCIDAFNNIFEYLQKNNIDIQQTFDKLKNKLVKNDEDSIKQADILRFSRTCDLASNPHLIYNGRYLHLLADSKNDIKDIVREYCCISYVDGEVELQKEKDKLNGIFEQNKELIYNKLGITYNADKLIENINNDTDCRNVEALTEMFDLKLNKIKSLSNTKNIDLDEFIFDIRDSFVEYRKMLKEFGEFIKLDDINTDFVKHTDYDINVSKRVANRVNILLKNKFGGNNSKQIKFIGDDGTEQIFNSQKECAESLNVDSRIIKKSLNSYNKKLKGRLLLV